MATIRPVQQDDVDAVQSVARTTWHATYDDILGPDAVDSQVDEWYDESIVREGISDDDIVYLVAVDDGAVVGYTAAGPTDEDDSAPAGLYSIYVLPNHWGNGVGKQLFDAVTDRLRERGFDRLSIRVLADNDRARAFYERQGYTVGERQTVELGGSEFLEVLYTGRL